MADFKFSHTDLKDGGSYTAGCFLASGKEAWVVVEMDDGEKWPSPTPTGPNVEYDVSPECNLKVAGGKGSMTSSSQVNQGYVPEDVPGGTFHSFGSKSIVAFGTMERHFATSYMVLKFIPAEAGQHTLIFEHKRPVEQKGYRSYKLAVYQTK